MKAISRVQLTRIGRNIKLVPFNQLKVNITTLLHSRVKFPHYHRFHVRVGVEEEEVRIIQKKVNTTTRALVKIFRIREGGGGNNHERTVDAYSTQSCIVPPLSINPKDHKLFVKPYAPEVVNYSNRSE